MKSRRSRTMVALATMLTLAAGVAEARPGGGGSSGSRGSRTFDAPSRTQTAPSARPIERSQTAPTQAQRPGAPVNQPAAAGSRFGGFGGGLMAGLLGAGLLGMLFGGGFLGGLGGLASMLGLLVQVALIAGLAYLAIRFFRRRNEPAMAPAYARQAGSGSDPRPSGIPGGLGGLGGLGMGAAQGAARPAQRSGNPDEIGVGPSDYAEFERGLVEIQSAYGREDVNALRELATPEMAGYLEEELRANAARGVVNRIGDVKLLQGDLAEAWRENGGDYATVAMRYALTDATFDRATNRLVGGDDRAPTEAREIWTFWRERGGRWTLSAIQQAA